MNKIFGIKLVNPSAPKKGINKEILKDISYGGETDYFVTKKVYEHREDELNFDYQYLVGVMDMAAIGGDEEINVCLSIVPTKESVCKKEMDKMLECFGIPFEQVEPYDFGDYGNYVQIAGESFTYEEWENEKEDILDLIASVIPTIDAFFGFYMDRCINRIGTTGWDMIESWVSGTDPYTAPFDRWKKRQEEDDE